MFIGHFTGLAFPQVAGYNLVFDEGRLYSLNSAGIQVMDPQKNVFLEIQNTIHVEKIYCYSRHSKRVLASKLKDKSTLILSHVKW